MLLGENAQLSSVEQQRTKDTLPHALAVLMKARCHFEPKWIDPTGVVTALYFDIKSI